MIGVYGSNGFIGKHLARRLAELGMGVRAVSRHHDPDFVASLSAAVEFQESDFTDPLAMAASLQDVDTVVQLVSTSSPGLRNEHAIADIKENVIPHVNFLRSCVQASVRRYLFISSGGTVYGPGAVVPTPETAPTQPVCSHGLTKLMVEKYIQMHGHVDGLNYLILRLANPFGPGQEFRKGQGLIPVILDRYQKRMPVKIFGKGEARRDYIYIDDVIDAIVAAINKDDLPSTILNIGSGKTRSVLEVIGEIEAATGHSFARDYTQVRSTDVEVSCLDISSARALLGWTPDVAFEDGIARTVAAWNQSRPSHSQKT